MRYALLSVTDKTGVAEFAKTLKDVGFTLLSTGGTATHLRAAGLEVVEVADFTGMAETLDGRVKTLHPKLLGGILAKGTAEHLEQLRLNGWPRVGLVVVNLYGFAGAVSKPGVTLDEAIEKIDVGGPTALRAAAKNFREIIVVCDPADYQQVAQSLVSNGDVALPLRFRLARKVFRLTAAYDQVILEYLRTVDVS
jgi:phosphoribosylaminoimidazolecarboxamide formyltransferase / IMP cyclohydrolase